VGEGSGAEVRRCWGAGVDCQGIERGEGETGCGSGARGASDGATSERLSGMCWG
jgi:hypothetical protein